MTTSRSDDRVTLADVKHLHDSVVAKVAMGATDIPLAPEQVLAICRAYQQHVVALREVCASSDAEDGSARGKAVSRARRLLLSIGVAVASH